MKRITAHNIQELKPGVEFIETEYGVAASYTVETEPTHKTREIWGKRHDQWEWWAILEGEDKPVRFLMTEGLEHYGPTIYFEEGE